MIMISTEPVAWQDGLHGQKSNETFLAEFAASVEVTTTEGNDYPDWPSEIRAYHDDDIDLYDPVEMLERALEDAGYSVLWREGVFIYQGEIEQCRHCERVTRVDEEPVDTDAADGWNGYCGGCADQLEGEEEGSSDG